MSYLQLFQVVEIRDCMTKRWHMSRVKKVFQVHGKGREKGNAGQRNNVNKGTMVPMKESIMFREPSYSV